MHTSQARPTMPAETDNKMTRLLQWFGREKSPAIAVALSGGIDSCTLAFAAWKASQLYGQAFEIHLVLGLSDATPHTDIRHAEQLAGRLGLALNKVQTRELQDPLYTENTTDRCFHCKKTLFARIASVLADGTRIIEGTTQDDLQGHRPGHRAAQQAGVRSPYVELGLTKPDIRWLAQQWELEDWSRPSSPCLSSRVAYGTPVTSERLQKIQRAEAYLRSLGFHTLRVRAHDSIARIEVPAAQITQVAQQAEALSKAFKNIGFTYATLDLQGYRSGSLLEVLQPSTSEQP